MEAANKQKRLAVAREWKMRNKERVKSYRALYYASNRTKELAANAEWVAANPRDKEHTAIVAAQYRSKNAEDLKAYFSSSRVKARKNEKARARYRSDPAFNAEKRIRACIIQAVRLAGTFKSASFAKLVGCTPLQLKAHIERQFSEGMAWNNIHIDHIRPCASFNLARPEEQIACFHFSNLRPLLAIDNQRKGSLWNGQRWHRAAR